MYSSHRWETASLHLSKLHGFEPHPSIWNSWTAFRGPLMHNLHGKRHTLFSRKSANCNAKLRAKFLCPVSAPVPIISSGVAVIHPRTRIVQCFSSDMFRNISV